VGAELVPVEQLWLRLPDAQQLQRFARSHRCSLLEKAGKAASG